MECYFKQKQISHYAMKRIYKFLMQDHELSFHFILLVAIQYEVPFLILLLFDSLRVFLTMLLIFFFFFVSWKFVELLYYFQQLVHWYWCFGGSSVYQSNNDSLTSFFPIWIHFFFSFPCLNLLAKSSRNKRGANGHLSVVPDLRKTLALHHQ